MTRDEGKQIWAIALKHHGAAALEQIVCRQIEDIYESSPDLDLPVGVSVGGLAEIVRSVLDDVVQGSRPLVVGDRVMNRKHLQALLQLKARLEKSLLTELPVELLTPSLRTLRVQIDFNV